MTTADRVILERYRDKCHAAGGVRPGYVLRRRAILLAGEGRPDLDLEAALSSLVEQEVLKSNEDGTFFFLTSTGAERIAELADG